MQFIHVFPIYLNWNDNIKNRISGRKGLDLTRWNYISADHYIWLDILVYDLSYLRRSGHICSYMFIVLRRSTFFLCRSVLGTAKRGIRARSEDRSNRKKQYSLKMFCLVVHRFELTVFKNKVLCSF